MSENIADTYAALLSAGASLPG